MITIYRNILFKKNITILDNDNTYFNKKNLCHFFFNFLKKNYRKKIYGYVKYYYYVF